MSTNNNNRLSRSVRSILRPFRLKKLTDAQRDDGNSIEPPLPLLPQRRPRPITSTLSQGSSHIDTTHKSYIQIESLIFTRLLPELRRSVLMEAFGERTLHFDLRLTRPFVNSVRFSSSDREAEHGYGRAPLSWYAVRDSTAPKTWRWWSCVCHRSMPFSESTKHQRGYQFPHRDRCIRGELTMCMLWSPERLPRACSGCAIGAMGWLQTCRQA